MGHSREYDGIPHLGLFSYKNDMRCTFHQNRVAFCGQYCERDVVALVQVYQKLLGMPVIELEQVEYV